ncbi:MAG: D-alanyl-D-alanine carboxypeptidase family protein [Lachnospiraceae bacterium]
MLLRKRKTILALCMLLILLLTSRVTDVKAAVNNGEVYPVATNAIEGWPQGPEITSETGVVMEVEPGAVVYDKGMNEARYPASITKILTTLLALENSSLTDVVTFTETGLHDMALGTNVGMQVGEQLTMEQCLYLIMIQSANEVSTQVAEFVGGTEANFIDMMNAKAAELGCTNTHFSNANGLPADDHYSTAYDMALIYREALKNEEFRKISSTLSYTVGPTNMNAQSRTVTSHHAALVPNTLEYYEGCFGGKTGYTDAAKRTLVTGACRNDIEYIVVLMRAEIAPIYAETSQLFDYAFSNFLKTDLEGGAVVYPNTLTVDALQTKTEETEDQETTQYFYQDHFLGQSVVETSVQQQTTGTDDTTQGAADTTELQTQEQPQTQSNFGTILMVLLIVVGVLLLFFIIWTILRIRKKNRRRRRRQKLY